MFNTFSAKKYTNSDFHFLSILSFDIYIDYGIIKPDILLMKVGDLMNIQIPHFTQLEDQFDLHFIDGDYKSAIKVAEQLLNNALDNNNTEMTMYTYLHLASCHYLIGEIENAFHYVLK